MLIRVDNVEDVLKCMAFDSRYRLQWASFNDMSRKEMPRRVASVRKRHRLDDRDVYSGSDSKVDFSQEDNTGVSIHRMYKLYKPLTQLCSDFIAGP